MSSPTSEWACPHGMRLTRRCPECECAHGVPPDRPCGACAIIEAERHRTCRVKDTNPKDAVGVRKWRQHTAIPAPPLWELGVAMLEGARKYGRHNYRVAGVRASVYVDAALGHIHQWWEGEDDDPDSGLSHITKAIASLFVLRDAMLNEMMADDRPPKAKLDAVRNELQRAVDRIMERHPDPKPPHMQRPDPGDF